MCDRTLYTHVDVLLRAGVLKHLNDLRIARRVEDVTLTILGATRPARCGLQENVARCLAIRHEHAIFRMFPWDRGKICFRDKTRLVVVVPAHNISKIAAYSAATTATTATAARKPALCVHGISRSALEPCMVWTTRRSCSSCAPLTFLIKALQGTEAVLEARGKEWGIRR